MYSNELYNQTYNSVEDDNDKDYTFKGLNKQFDSCMKISKLIGKSKTGEVYQCLNKTNRSLKLAVKIFERKNKFFRKIDHYTFKLMIMNEIQNQMRCRHKNIIAGLGHFTLGENAFAFIQELGSRGNLLDFLDCLRKNVPSVRVESKYESFSESIICYVAHNLVSAIEHLHSLDFVHQDIKPENILVDDECEMKLTDFSVSKKLFLGYYHNFREGTSEYMAPEKLSNTFVSTRELFKSDYYSLGVLLYKLKFGYLPFNIGCRDSLSEQFYKINNNPLEFDQKVEMSEGMKDFLIGLLQANFKDRFNIENIVNHPWLNKCKLIYSLKENYFNLEKFFFDLLNDSIIS